MHTGLMPDTATRPGISNDAELRLRITPAAINRARRRLHVHTIDELGERLGFSRQTFWRLRHGKHDIRLSKATAVAQQIGWPIDRVFEPVTHG